MGAAASRSTGGARSIRLRRALIVAEIALATVLVASAGLFARSFVALHHVDLGFDPQNLASFNIRVPTATVDSDPKLLRFYLDLRERL